MWFCVFDGKIMQIIIRTYTSVDLEVTNNLLHADVRMYIHENVWNVHVQLYYIICVAPPLL